MDNKDLLLRGESPFWYFVVVVGGENCVLTHLDSGPVVVVFLSLEAIILRFSSD